MSVPAIPSHKQPNIETGHQVLLNSIFQNKDIFNCVLATVKTSGDGTKGFLSPLGLLVRVNKVFRDVVKERCKQELSTEEIGRFLIKETKKVEVHGSQFLINCKNFHAITANG